MAKFKLGELFSGPGGLALGAIRATVRDYSIEHAWASDINEDSCRTYRNNISPHGVIQAPVADLAIKKLSPIDAFAYGFPCNDFSVVGEQRGTDGQFGPLYSFGITVLDHLKPKWFLAENVGGLQSANEGRAFGTILNALSNAGPGYRLVPHLYRFEEYGVPQTRHRIIIIGTRKDLNIEYKVPAPTTPLKTEMRTARQALEHPPIAIDAANHERTKQSESVVKRLGHIPAGGNAWNENIPEKLRLNTKGAKLSQIYRRLHPDRPSYTITGSGGGGTHGYHWGDPRALTNRERARIQTFPDDFVFSGKKESVRRQIGMAVPPDGVQIIVESVLKTFAGVSYKSVPARWNHNGARKD